MQHRNGSKSSKVALNGESGSQQDGPNSTNHSSNGRLLKPSSTLPTFFVDLKGGLHRTQAAMNEANQGYLQ